MTVKLFLSLVIFFILSACATIDVTKTSKGFFEPTNPNEVEILKINPVRPFIELGTVTVAGFSASETAKMHNAIRSKSSMLGANAVILTEEGILPPQGIFVGPSKWATGVAIRFQ